MVKARILLSFNNALMAAWMKEPLCCKSQEEEKQLLIVEKEYSSWVSGQESSRCSQG